MTCHVGSTARRRDFAQCFGAGFIPLKFQRTHTYTDFGRKRAVKTGLNSFAVL